MADSLRFYPAMRLGLPSYRKATLIERFGADVVLPHLLHLIANCDRNGKLGDACGVHYDAQSLMP